MADTPEARIRAAVADIGERHVTAMLAELNRLPLDCAPEPVGGTARKISRRWARITPGTEGRLLSYGGTSDDAWVWIDVRPERGTDAI